MSSLDDNGVPSGESNGGGQTAEEKTLFSGNNCSTQSHLAVSLCAGVKGNVQGNLFKIITQSDTRYFIQAPSHQDKMSWIDAIREQTL